MAKGTFSIKKELCLAAWGLVALTSTPFHGRTVLEEAIPQELYLFPFDNIP